MHITYLMNSGFAVELEHTLLVFDAYEDPARAIDKVLVRQAWEHVYFFASHSHYDHFNGDLLQQYAPYADRYILSHDIRHTVGARKLPAEKCVFLDDYSHWEADGIAVDSYSSTDIGTSLAVMTEGKILFHAGDYNWWDWTGDTHENRMLAANGFHKQLKRLSGLVADVAFFPVDGRLETSMAKGAKEFCAACEVHALVTMHSVGFPRCRVPDDFFETGKEIPVWSPVEAGEAREIDNKGDFR